MSDVFKSCPLPWIADDEVVYDANKYEMFEFSPAPTQAFEDRAIAAEIVKRVNVHDDLVKALERIANPNKHGDPTPREAAFIRDIARTALAKVPV